MRLISILKFAAISIRLRSSYATSSRVRKSTWIGVFLEANENLYTPLKSLSVEIGNNLKECDELFDRFMVKTYLSEWLYRQVVFTHEARKVYRKRLSLRSKRAKKLDAMFNILTGESNA